MLIACILVNGDSTVLKCGLGPNCKCKELLVHSFSNLAAQNSHLGNLKQNSHGWVSYLEIFIKLVENMTWTSGYLKLEFPHKFKCEAKIENHFFGLR